MVYAFYDLGLNVKDSAPYNMIINIFKKIRTRVLPNLKYLKQSKIRTCRCCLKKSLIVSLSYGEEYKFCIRCKANLRYEMLADYIRNSCPSLDKLTVLELDPHSPLRKILSKSKKYIRTYFSASDPRGFARYDGARCEDITNLTLESGSVDIIISSDVLEHVANISAAFEETYRVLRIGGFHLLQFLLGLRQ
jgi:hypothetical protein